MSHETFEPIEQIAKVAKVSRSIDQVEAVGQQQLGKEAPDQSQFAQLMAEKSQEMQRTRVETDPSIKRPNPIETAQETQRTQIHYKDDAFQGLIAESRDNMRRLGDLHDRLKTANVELSRPIRSSMQRSLIHIDENLKIALSRVGVDYSPPANQAPGLVAPVQKFLGYLSNSQTQLESLSNQLTTIHTSEAAITPALMLGLQLKMGVITQQVEFFASLLNKALESTKTVMNVQV
jgi:hypothetical protein